MPYRVVEVTLGPDDQVKVRTPLPQLFETEVSANSAITRIIATADLHGIDTEQSTYWAVRNGERFRYAVEAVPRPPAAIS